MTSIRQIAKCFGGKSPIFDLQSALRDKDFGTVMSILNNNRHINWSDVRFIDRSTPISFAIYKGWDHFVQSFLNYGFDPNKLSTDSCGRVEPPLCTAIRLGNYEIIDILLKHKDIDVNKADIFLQTPLYLCVRYKWEDILHRILNFEGFNVNSQIYQNMWTNPLYLSAQLLRRGRVMCFQYLISAGLKPTKEIIELVIESDNYVAMLFTQMALGRVISQKKYVLTLKQLSRSVVRNCFVQRSGLPLNETNISKHLTFLPIVLREYLTHLGLY